MVSLKDEGIAKVAMAIYLKVELASVLDTFKDRICVWLVPGSLSLIQQHLPMVVKRAHQHQETEYKALVNLEERQSYYNACKYPIQTSQRGFSPIIHF